MFESIDNYCERVGSGLLAEPLNAITNLAFIIAALVGWRLASQMGLRNFQTALMTCLMFCIGVGSTLFHTFATGWAELADIFPIIIFQVTYMWFYCQHVAGIRGVQALVCLALFLVILVLGFALPSLGLIDDVWLAQLNGSAMYSGAWLGVLALAIFHFVSDQTKRYTLLLAAAVFSLSLVFRTLDMALCEYLPIGTHFLWHGCNALVLYLSLSGYLYAVKGKRT